MTALGILIGVDAGGTKTDVTVADESGRTLARSISGGANPSMDGVDEALATIVDAIHAALAQLEGVQTSVLAVAAGIAGVDRPSILDPMQRAFEELFVRVPCRVVTDPELLLSAAFDDEVGIALIAGTGSICVGRDPSGHRVRAGGWGALAGDEGSAYDIGLAAIRATLRAHDGRAAGTALAAAVGPALGAPSAPEIIDRLVERSISRATIAAIAPAVIAAAGGGDEAAREITRSASQELARAVYAVAKRLATPPPIPLALGGGLLVNFPVFAGAVVEEARSLGAQLGPIAVVREPVNGAVRMAKRLVQRPLSD